MSERFRSNRTGSVVVTDAETAARMGLEWEPFEEKKASPKRRAKSDDDK